MNPLETRVFSQKQFKLAYQNVSRFQFKIKVIIAEKYLSHFILLESQKINQFHHKWICIVNI